MRDLIDAPIEPIHEEPKELQEELNATTELTMNQQMGDNLMMGNQQQQQQDDQQGLLMLPKQTTSTMANLNTSLVDTKVAAKAEEEYPDELAGELKNESSASKKNRASKVKKASKKYNKAEAARQNKAMLSTRQRLESRNEALKNASGDKDGEMLGNPPADLSYEEKKTYTKQEKAALEATIAEIEAISAHELAKLEAKKKFHVDKKTRNGIMLDTDTMRLQVDCLSQQKAAWEEYGSRQQLGDKEAMLVEKKMAALQKKMDSLEEKKTEIQDERYRQQWVEDGNIAENGMLISSSVQILDDKELQQKTADFDHVKYTDRSLRKKIQVEAMPVGAQIALFTENKMPAISHNDEDFSSDPALDADDFGEVNAPAHDHSSDQTFEVSIIGVVERRIQESLHGLTASSVRDIHGFSRADIPAKQADWIEEKRDAKENPQLYPKYSKTDWIQKPPIGTLEDEKAAYQKIYNQERKLFDWRYHALDVSIDAQNMKLNAEKLKQNPRFTSSREKEVAGWSARMWEEKKEEWHKNMANGGDFCESYFTNLFGSVASYTPKEMEERKKIYAEVIAERGDADSMELAEKRTELKNTLGYVPTEMDYQPDTDSEYDEGEDEELLEENEQRFKENGAKEIAALNELREEEKNAQQIDTTKYVYKPPEHELEKGRTESYDSHVERNKKYFALHPKMDYMQWQINALNLRLLHFRNATLTGEAMSRAEKKEHASMEKKLLSLRLKYAEQIEQLKMLQYKGDDKTDRRRTQKEDAYKEMLEQKMYALQTYAAQTAPHSREQRSAMKQAEAARQKHEDWRETCEKREAAYQWKKDAPAREAAAKRKAEREAEEKEAREAEEKAQKEMPAAEKKVQQEKPAQ